MQNKNMASLASKKPFGPRVRHESTHRNVQIDVKSLNEVCETPVVVHWRVDIIAPQPFAQPAHPKQQPSKVLHRRTVQKPVSVQPQELYFDTEQVKGRGLFGLFRSKHQDMLVDHN